MKLFLLHDDLYDCPVVVKAETPEQAMEKLYDDVWGGLSEEKKQADLDSENEQMRRSHESLVEMYQRDIEWFTKMEDRHKDRLSHDGLQRSKRLLAEMNQIAVPQHTMESYAAEMWNSIRFEKEITEDVYRIDF